MKKRLCELLVCPSCRKKMELEVFEEDKEIKEGLFRCACGKIYPIVNYVPRMLLNALQFHPDFIRKYKERLGDFKVSEKEIEKYEKLYKQTKERFEFQWKTWGNAEKIYGKTKEEEIDYFFNMTCCRHEERGEFRGKLLLEGGCGHGRNVDIMADLGAEVIGIDLGEGVEVAHKRNEKHEKAHIVQADILNMPFAEQQFDYVYSMGVIHHTPDTRTAFGELAKRVKREGILKIWVYPKEALWWEITQPAIRNITTRLPPKILYRAAYLGVPLLYFVKTYSGTHPGKNTPKECVQCIYDWFSPKYQTHHTEKEIAGWFKEEGFSEISFAKIKTGACGIKVG